MRGEESMYCIKCGCELPEEADFCYKCGTKVVKKETVSEAYPNIEKKVNKEDKKERRAWGIIAKVIIVSIFVLVFLICVSKDSEKRKAKAEELAKAYAQIEGSWSLPVEISAKAAIDREGCESEEEYDFLCNLWSKIDWYIIFTNEKDRTISYYLDYDVSEQEIERIIEDYVKLLYYKSLEKKGYSQEQIEKQMNSDNYFVSLIESYYSAYIETDIYYQLESSKIDVMVKSAFNDVYSYKVKDGFLCIGSEKYSYSIDNGAMILRSSEIEKSRKELEEVGLILNGSYDYIIFYR